MTDLATRYELDLAAVEYRYTADSVPPCVVCGSALAAGTLPGVDGLVFTCLKAYGTRATTTNSANAASQSDHYRRSMVHHVRTGDPEVLLLVELYRQASAASERISAVHAQLAELAAESRSDDARLAYEDAARLVARSTNAAL